MGFIRRHIRYSIIPVIFVLFTTGILSGEVKEGDFTTGISGGILSVDKGDTSPTVRLDIEYNITNHLAFDVSIMTTLNYDDSDGFTSITISPLMYLSPESSLSPYLTLGGGIAFLDISGENSTELTFIIGGGINYSIVEGVSLRFDLRDYITKDNSMRNNLSLTAGIVFYFDPVKEEGKIAPLPESRQESVPETPVTSVIEKPTQQEVTPPPEKSVIPEASKVERQEEKITVKEPSERSITQNVVTPQPEIEKLKSEPVPEKKVEALSQVSQPVTEPDQVPVHAQEKKKVKLGEKKKKGIKNIHKEKKMKRVERGLYKSKEDNILELIKEEKKSYKGRAIKKSD